MVLRKAGNRGEFIQMPIARADLGDQVSESGIASSETHMRFSYKNPVEHLACMFGQPKSLLALLGWTVAVFGIIMTVPRAAAYVSCHQ